jgi:levanase/fructan beta-fructosidase
VKLAIDRVDYYVPYELKNARLLDIEFHGDRRQKGAVGEFVCWKEIKFSDTFDTANREKFRPIYHHTPLYGWMNDPNGMFYKDGVWHLFYQYNPYGSQWENMHWGHSTSRDLVHWESQPLTFEPDWLGSIFSGSCVTNGNEVVAFYTSAGHHQTQSMAVSKDNGRTFKKYEGNPVITSDQPDFRDPNVFWYEPTKRWVMILAVGQEMQIYSSADMKAWNYESSFGKEYGNHGGVWECPDLFSIDGKWVLLCNINPGGPFGGSATQYFVGDWDGTTFTCMDSKKEQKWLDYGKDHYATVTWHNAPQNRVVALGWMSNWQYANEVPTKQFRSQNTIARDLSLYVDDKGEYRVGVRPSVEVMRAKGESVRTLGAEAIVEVKCPAGKSNTVITLENDKGEKVVMTYNFKKKTFSMDRHKSGKVSFSKQFPATTTVPLFMNQDTYTLTLFIDRCSIEAFDGNGAWSMTNLVFPTKPYNKVSVSNGDYTIYKLKL